MALGLGLGLALACIARVAEAQLFSPGPLSAAHARLDGDTGCDRCHGDGRKVVEERCLACHPAVQEGLRSGHGYHAQQVRSTGKTCGSCHPEHHGRDFPLIRWDPRKVGFRHEETGWPLAGAHQAIDCQRCHRAPQHRYMGLSRECRSCHADPHQPSLGPSCATCHDERAFRPAPRFDHARARFPLEGRHAQVACNGCHPPASPAAQATGTTAMPKLRFRGLEFGGCEACHRDPHQGQMGQRPCASCHTPRDFHEILGGLRERHAPGVFPLRGAHLTVACDRCHPSGQAPRSAPTRCDGCHQSPHRSDLGARCDACHSERGWHASAGERFPHERTRFPLRGRHAAVACGSCHGATGSRGTFAARFLDRHFERCSDCHGDPHRTEYRTVASATACESCHGEEGFAPSRFASARHGAPLFPLEGAHRAVPCADCHRRAAGAAGDLTPRTPAAGAAARTRPPAWAMHPAAGDCADCHQNPHGDAFQSELRERGCRGCHTPQGWHSARIDHDRTGFPLTGRHAQIDCAWCHTRLGPGGERDYRSLAPVCGGCHGDPHLGQFAATEPRKDCAACHATTRWSELGFVHDRDSRFPLAGRHAEQGCPACHETRKTPAGQVTVYRHGRVRCQDCHDNHHQRRPWQDGAGSGGAR
jgi:hypothetical protein